MMPAGSSSLREHAEVERLVVVEHPDLGIEGGRLAFPRLVLHEVARERRLGPRGLVERAVESNRAGRADGREMAGAARGVVSHLTALSGCRSTGGQGDAKDRQHERTGGA